MKKLLLALVIIFNLNINAQKTEIKFSMDSLTISDVNDKKLVKLTSFEKINLTKVLDSLQKTNNINIFIINMYGKSNGIKTVDSRYFYDLNKYTEDDIKRIDKKRSRKVKLINRI